MSGPFRDADEGLRVRAAEVRRQLAQLQQDEKVASDRLKDALDRMNALSAPGPRWDLRVFLIGAVAGALVGLAGWFGPL